VTDWHSRTSAGSEFQMDGATATERALRRAMSVLVLGTTNVWPEDGLGKKQCNNTVSYEFI